MICHNCKTEIKIEGFISRSDTCQRCGEDIRACLNCLNYDPAAHNKCREPNAEWVSDREKANFCDLFAPNKLAGATAAGKPSADPRNAFDNLFKK